MVSSRVLNILRMQSPETKMKTFAEIDVGKILEITLGELIFGGF